MSSQPQGQKRNLQNCPDVDKKQPRACSTKKQEHFLSNQLDSL